MLIKTLKLSAWTLLLLPNSVFAVDPQADIAALKKQQKTVQAELHAKYNELSDLRTAAYKSDAVAPLEKVSSAAFQAMRTKEQTDAKAQQARKLRDDANQARDAVVTAEVAATAEGDALMKQIEASKAQIKASEAAIKLAEQKLSDVRKKVQAESAKVAAANGTAKQAFESYQQVAAKSSSEEKAKHDKARNAVDTKVAELLSKDARVTAIKKAIEELSKTDRELSDKIRTAERPAKEAKPADDKPKDKGK